MQYIPWAIGMWCMLWWAWGLHDVFTDKPWITDEIEKKGKKFPAWFRVSVFVVIGTIYVLTAPFNKPRWWIQKEISKRRCSRHIRNIERTLDEAEDANPQIRQTLHQLETAIRRSKDKDW